MVLTIDSDFGTARTALMTRRRTSRLPLGHQSLSWGALSVHRLGVEGAVGVGVATLLYFGAEGDDGVSLPPPLLVVE